MSRRTDFSSVEAIEKLLECIFDQILSMDLLVF